MRTNTTWLSRLVAMVVLALAFAGVPHAQTVTRVDTRTFEVIAVDGNKLVVRDERGTTELTVPPDFRFMVDGKSMAVSDLKAGMKGTATVTTSTTALPVFVTEVREADVLHASSFSVDIRGADGQARRFTQGELDKRGVQVVKNGQPVRLADLRRGDKLTAVIVTSGAPIVLTEQQVQATLDAAKAVGAANTQAGAATSAPAAATTTAPAGAATTQGATSAPAGASTSAAPASTPAPTTSVPASPPAAASGLGMTWWVLIAILIALAVYFFMRRKKEP